VRCGASYPGHATSGNDLAMPRPAELKDFLDQTLSVSLLVENRELLFV